MERNFSRALDAVLQYEGGYSNNAKDPGGPTNLGVTLENFRRYVKPTGSIEDLKALTRDQAGVVFRRYYWDEVHGSALPDGVDLVTFDYAVNSGPGRAAKTLQRCVGATPDGVIASETMKAVDKVDKNDLINMICDKRLAFLQQLPTFATFGKGWTHRVDAVRKLAHELAAQSPDAPVVVIKRDAPAAPVTVEVEKPVAVVPKGSGSRSWVWPAGLTAFAGSGISTFADIPTPWKIGFGIAGLAAIVIFLFLGEVIIRRVKALRNEINAG